MKLKCIKSSWKIEAKNRHTSLSDLLYETDKSMKEEDQICFGCDSSPRSASRVVSKSISKSVSK